MLSMEQHTSHIRKSMHPLEYTTTMFSMDQHHSKVTVSVQYMVAVTRGAQGKGLKALTP